MVLKEEAGGLHQSRRLFHRRGFERASRIWPQPKSNMKRIFSRLLAPKPATSVRTAPRAPDGCTIWAIGDVHGRLDLLRPLVSEIQQDAARQSGRVVAVFLGDYVDRGPESRGVIEFLTHLGAGGPVEWRFLLGNHEKTMLDFITDPSVGPQWCEFGGDATLASYGLKLPTLKHKTEAWTRLAADLDHKLTKVERAFLEGLELSISFGGYFFSHAGARPGLPLDRQSERDLLWIRNSFLESPTGFDRVVVHGHTPSREVHIDDRRIGVDTKAYASGVLSAVRLQGDHRAVVQSVEGEGGVVAIRWPQLIPV